MKVLASAGTDEIALVYIADFGDGKLAEFVESLQPPFPREKKWVLIVSTLFGCPVGCLMCDAGYAYEGKLSRDDIFAQIDFLIEKRFPDGILDVEKFKIQFARMGEPAFNLSVLTVLEELRDRYRAPGLMTSLSTVAPAGTTRFFDRLLEIKKSLYAGGGFQFQFSIHTTDETLRDRLIPIKKWPFAEMAAYGERFFAPGDRKITLNFALAGQMPVEPNVLACFFDPAKFLLKITPLNPTYKAGDNGLTSHLNPYKQDEKDTLVEGLRRAGYDVIVSIGEPEENRIGSNCGQYVLQHIVSRKSIPDGYSYKLQPHGQIIDRREIISGPPVC